MAIGVSPCSRPSRITVAPDGVDRTSNRPGPAFVLIALVASGFGGGGAGVGSGCGGGVARVSGTLGRSATVLYVHSRPAGAAGFGPSVTTPAACGAGATVSAGAEPP